MLNNTWEEAYVYVGKEYVKLEGYFVNKDGQIKNKYGKILKPYYIGKNRDRAVIDFKNFNGTGKRKQIKVHRIVLSTFDPDGYDFENGVNIVNHKDENPKNNKFSNLHWCTQAYNVIYSLNLRMQRKGENLKEIIDQVISDSENNEAC